ncbi:uncharacterized protein [Elaeis guineensis]|uniref:uncharacterized protein n=1 Tax=Elaeis guineensis var. tenera TaxID=51953 RepID=UPI003C6D991D
MGGNVGAPTIESTYAVMGDVNPPLVIEFMVPLSKVKTEALLEEISVREILMEETSAEPISMEEAPAKGTWMKKTVGHPGETPVAVIEAENPSEQAVPAAYLFLPTTSQAGPLQPVPAAPSAAENLKSAAKFLRNFLSLVEKLFLEEQEDQQWMVSTLRSLAQVGHHLASFIGFISDVSALELTAVREEIDLLKYWLEQAERTNTELTRELNSFEEAL